MHSRHDSCRTARSAWPRAAGLGLGLVADAVLGDPRRGHPVAGFGRAAQALERQLYADRRGAGVLFTGACVGSCLAAGAVLERACRNRPVARVLLTATATWAVVGATSLAREGSAMAGLVEAGQVQAARDRLTHLCARDPAGLGLDELARASVESLAENASDAVVAPLLWGAVAGLPGLLGYRAANTLDAMVGYRSPRYLRFGWASARLDDVLNLVPARVTAALFAVAAPAVAGSPAAAARADLRDGSRHPSPNAGYPEAAVAGALGVTLGGANVYGGHLERRPVLGEGGRPARVEDLRRVVRLGRVTTALAAVVSVGVCLAGVRLRGRVRPARGPVAGRAR